MKKLFLTLFLTVITTAMLQAQQISVVSSGGTTKLYSTLADAINGAEAGSVIYLPGGGFPISDDVKITKKLTIIGIGHKIDTENVDGYTTISGNLFFNQGSDGSALVGCYITGNICIGEDSIEVDDMLIKFCNLYQIIVYNNKCKGTFVNQNYIRAGASFGGSSGKLNNNVIGWIFDLDDGFVSNNIITSWFANSWQYGRETGAASLHSCDRLSITNNIILHNPSNHVYGGNIQTGENSFSSGNMCIVDWGDDCINIVCEGFDWANVFQNYQGVSPTSNFHFTDEYKQYEGKVGIYSGTGFNDDQLAPVPYIVAKHVDQQTDAQGKLNIKIRVKAGQ